MRNRAVTEILWGFVLLSLSGELMGTRARALVTPKFSTQGVPRSAPECGAGSRLLKACCIGIRLPFALASAFGTIVLVGRLIHEYGTIRKHSAETFECHEFT